MLYLISLFSAILNYYRKCPNCGKQQHFKGRKKGDTVRCIKCGQEFVLK